MIALNTYIPRKDETRFKEMDVVVFPLMAMELAVKQFRTPVTDPDPGHTFKEIERLLFPTRLSQTELSWYLPWLRNQANNIHPNVIRLLERATDPDDIISSQSHVRGDHQNRLARVLDKPFPEETMFRALLETINFAKGQTNPSIDEIVNHLISTSFMTILNENVDSPDLQQDFESARHLAFGFLGWTTMLYTPASRVCPPCDFAIEETLNGYTQGSAFILLKQPSERSRYNAKTFLKGFGLLLPPPNVCYGDEPGEKAAYEATIDLSPADLNYYFLREFAGIKIKWIDSMAAHMEMDMVKGILFLFRFPSFCLGSIPPSNPASPPQAGNENIPRVHDSVIQRYFSPLNNNLLCVLMTNPINL